MTSKALVYWMMDQRKWPGHRVDLRNRQGWHPEFGWRILPSWSRARKRRKERRGITEEECRALLSEAFPWVSVRLIQSTVQENRRYYETWRRLRELHDYPEEQPAAPPERPTIYDRLNEDE
jgi:hypothetical protein